MKQLVLAALLALTPPASAQEAAPEQPGDGLFDNGLRGLLEDFALRMAPSLEEMQDRLGPALEEFAERLGALDAYHPPEILPNGDIIIRRKRPGEALPPIEPGDPDGEIEL